MRRFVLVGLVLAAPAFAQTPPVVAPPVLAAPAPPPPLETWLPRPGVELAGLDKITARVSPVVGKIGQALTFGTLTVTVRSCLVRGPDQPQDQAAFLDVTDSRDPAFAFHGWMLLSVPGDTAIEHPVYDVRLTRCTG